MTYDVQMIHHGPFTVTVETPQVLLNEALAASALIGKVTSEEENDLACAALGQLDTFIKKIEDQRVEAKAPYLEMGRKIDRYAKEVTADAKAEHLRLRQLVSDFAALDMAKLKAAEAARIADLSEIDKRRQTEIAAAKSLDEIDEIQARYDEEVKSLPPLPQPTRAEGQRVTKGWDIVVSDIHTLARFHPNCVKIEPKLSEITIMLDEGYKVAGIIATPKVVSGVRVSKDAVLTI